MAVIGFILVDTRVLMQSWDSKIPFPDFFELSDSQQMYGKLWLYLLQSCACKVDNLWGCIHVSFPKKLISRNANITALDVNNVLVVTEGEDTIDHSEITKPTVSIRTMICFVVSPTSLPMHHHRRRPSLPHRCPTIRRRPSWTWEYF